MTRHDLKSAREIAAEVLHRFDPVRDYAGPILDRLLDQTHERQRATDLVYGTIRNLSAIDAVITALAGRPTSRITPLLLSIIRVAVYELGYSPATPVYSIVDEAVKNAGKAHGRKQTGFVNAVLRQIVRHIANRQVPLAQAQPRRTLIQTTETGCELDADVLPDPAASLAAYLSTCFSLPVWLVSRWLTEFGPEQTRRICFACNRRPSLYIRVNPLRAKTEGLLARFAQAGIQAELTGLGGGIMPERPVCSVPVRASEETPHGVTTNALDDATQPPDMIRIAGPHAVTQLPGFAEGMFAVQDLSASQAVRLLAPQPGWSILDLCSAPGTKTTQLAEATRDAAQITATDIDPERLERVRENITRLGLKSITILPYAQLEERKGPQMRCVASEKPQAGPFDAILLDVPCSNTGVLARRVEARFRVTPPAVKNIAAIQKGLLERAAGLVKPGGRIAYSTCSIQRQENQDMVSGFLAANSEFELVREELLLPAAEPIDHDGAYIAMLRRIP